MAQDPCIDPMFANARKFAERSYGTFITNLNGMSISQYFNIECLNISLQQINILNYILKIEYKNTYPDLIKLLLPYDTIKHIKSYVERRFVLSLNIFYIRDTPFKPPLWTPIHIKTFNFKVKELEYIIKRQVYENKLDWSPSILLEKDILYFIERIMLIL
jgi:hypothetical protein